MEIGQAIARMRKQKGWGQSELAERATIPQPNLSAIETGRRDLTVSTLCRLALALEVPAASLLDEATDLRPSLGPLTRSRVEKMARAVVAGREKLSAPEKKAVFLLKSLAPETAVRRFSSRQATEAWTSLKGLIGAANVKILLEKVRDAAQRQRHR